VLFFVVALDRPDRFWWLWPVQVIVLAALFVHIPSRFGVPKIAIWIGQTLLLVAVAANPLLIARIHAWIQSGWSGSNADQLVAVDYVAEQMRAKGERSAPVGYALDDKLFMAAFNIADSRYKIGARLDFLMWHRHRF